jgi:hypothetical protein
LDIDYSHLHVCIPAFKEENILPTLESLKKCHRENFNIHISVLVNQSSEADNDIDTINKNCINDLESFNESNPHFPVSYDFIVFPSKHAGVGLARKTLMDNAAKDFKANGFNGLIIALDADTVVENIYFTEISEFFKGSSYNAASIHYEHPLDSMEIIEYEFHLRYYNSMQYHSGFPFAIHTVGSAMVCTSDAYLKKGGMNKRKAGEDFYFMQKFIKDQVCGNITRTKVIPSSRSSDRVPFGTGRAILKYDEEGYSATTYNPHSFEKLRKFNQYISEKYDDDSLEFNSESSLDEFLDNIELEKNLELCKKHTADKNAFMKRFYQFFDAFTLMKCLHFMRQEFPDILIKDAAEKYSTTFHNSAFYSVKQSLLDLRKEEVERFKTMN